MGSDKVEKYGEAFVGVLKDDKYSVYPNFLNLVRRLILVVLMIYMTNYPLMLIFCFIIL
jgi:hypothetical protein